MTIKRKLFPLLLLILFSITVQAQNNPITTIILFRHAEAADDGSKDPPLAEKGKMRAAELSRVLSNIEIDAVYSTKLNRTIGTAQEIANKRNLEIIYYDPFSESFIDEILEKHKGQTIAISGHSNTTPKLVNKLIGEEKYADLEHYEYDNIFIVTHVSKDEVRVIQLHYGEKTD